MKLTKENIYIDLRGKSKEELIGLQNILIIFNETTYRKDFKTYYKSNNYNYLEFSDGEWLGSRTITQNKQEVTIQQLKEILQPMDLTIEQRLEKAEADVKRLQSLIEEENNIKVGDWVYVEIAKCFFKVKKNDITYIDHRHKKITNPELIKLLEQEIK